ncbi:hypothetical protein D3C72_2215980 [compost metagenome]
MSRTGSQLSRRKIGLITRNPWKAKNRGNFSSLSAYGAHVCIVNHIANDTVDLQKVSG